MFGRQKLATIVAEFLGTGVLTLVFLSVLRSQLALGFFIALAAGLALAVMAFAVGRISGGYFNPALTLGAWTSRRLSTVTAAVYIAAQFLGAFLAYLLFTYLINNKLPASKATFNGRVLTAEVVGTAIYAFGFAAALGYQRVANGAYAVVSGVSYVVGILAASSVLGLAFLNPAIALAARTFVWGTYVLGSVIGAVVGFGLYQLLFAAAGEVVDGGSIAAAAATPAPKRSSRVTTTAAAKKLGSQPKKTTRRK